MNTGTALHPAFRGHGLFCYQPQQTVRHYNGYEGHATDMAGTLTAFRAMGVSHVWIRLFGHEGKMPLDEAKPLVEALRNEGIALAGWGYSHGTNWQRDLGWAIDGATKLKLDAFVADIEPGRPLDGSISKWRTADLTAYIDGLARHFGKTNLGVSTWPMLRIQNEPGIGSLGLMRAIADKISFFAPQVYWMSFPTDVHYDTTGLREAVFPRDNPSSFARMVIRSWRDEGFTNDLLITGQAYWGEGRGPPLSVMERKISEFAAGFDGWGDIIGLNWWHAGGRLAMSRVMTQAIVAGRFQSRAYRTPAAALPDA